MPILSTCEANILHKDLLLNAIVILILELKNKQTNKQKQVLKQNHKFSSKYSDIKQKSLALNPILSMAQTLSFSLQEAALAIAVCNYNDNALFTYTFLQVLKCCN